MADQLELCSPNRIGIYVLSERLGESVVVTLPDGKWFVVDAFRGAPDPADPSPVGHFIDHFALPASNCLFVLLTHLHEDHYSGITRLLNHLRSQGAGDQGRQRPYPPFATHPAYRCESIADEVERILDWQANNPLPEKKKSGKSIRAIDEKNQGRKIRVRDVMALCRRDFEDVAPWRIVYENREDTARCRVFVFLPAKSIQARYLRGRAAKRRLRELVTDKPLSRKLTRQLMEKQNTILNDMSIGLAIEYGKTCVLLTGDGEVESWKAIGRDPGPQLNPHRVSNPIARANFLKAPHHASSRAWNPILERVYAGSRWAIATHHDRGSYCLPDADGVEKILDQGVNLAVPDGRLVRPDVPNVWRTLPPDGFQTCSVSGRRNASADEAQQIAKQYRGGTVRPALAEDEEVQWVGTLLDATNRTRQWFGGSQATFLRKS